MNQINNMYNIDVATVFLRPKLKTNTDSSYAAALKSAQQINDAEAYKKYLSEKFGGRVSIATVAKDQHSLESAGSHMGGRDVIIAPNIFNEMLNDKSKAYYYESKINYFFENIPKYTKQCAARGLTFEPCGVVVHEDGTVTFICGGEDSPERKAKVAAINALKQKKRRERIEMLNDLLDEKYNLHIINNLAVIRCQQLQII